ncbi:PhzF family phenazine biosynthesis protein [Mycobacterium antarcticum]|uniref:PhzF family phenazine biosynthesis protein n=1 Tax=Mycolicibacterium sp. TUM20984 TaxID=3023368 RepID=UPI0024E0B7FD|nr:PhzF family phenazine biosynthesis protein [Mycolicibacterium sp. TUM20984]
MNLAYCHVDVFSPSPFGGNSLPVFPDAGDLSAKQMLRITQELRHFEAIFLKPGGQPGTVGARIFDLLGELAFAGHPLIGAAAVLHDRSGGGRAQRWQFELPGRTAEVTTEVNAGDYSGLLDQGTPEFYGALYDCAQLARALNLTEDDLDPDLPIEVVSTGLRYLIVPVRPGALSRARISRDITGLLQGAGAQFAVLFDESAVEIRHWNNDGIIEDVATGSAAGTIGAYRLRHGLVRGGVTFILNQGQFTGRPSKLRVLPEGSRHRVERIKVGGDVSFVGHGVIEARP